MRSLLLLFFLVPLVSYSQLIGGKTENGGKRWNIRFVLDGTPIPFFMQTQERYQGEYFLGDQQWEWREWDSVRNYSFQNDWFFNLRLGAQLNVVKNLYVGVNYSGYIAQRRKVVSPDFSYLETIPFVSLNASLSYPIQIGRKIELLPTVSAGNYQSDSYYGYEGLGNEWSVEGRLGVCFRLKGEYLRYIRLWTAYHHFAYRESAQSWVYPERIRTIETDWQFFNAGIGLVWHLQIDED